jgi:hypothetical protein
MIIHKVRYDAEENQPFTRMLCSDWHLGSSCSNHDLIVRDLAMAKRHGSRVIVNGDVFDAICATDKRYQAGVLHPSLEGKKDLAKAIVNLAFDLVSPYADVIDIMGIGNHEEAWTKYNHGDPVAALIEKLNEKAGCKIKHGGFWGYINSRFKLKGLAQQPLHRLLYLHGTGGDSPVTKGTIDFNRKGRNWAYDALTFGHKHNEVCAADAIADTSEDDAYIERKQLNLQTPSYYRNYRELKEGEELDQSYAASKGHPPKPMGSLWLTMRPRRADSGLWYVHQDYSSEHPAALVWNPTVQAA